MKRTQEFYEMKIVEGVAADGNPGYRLEPWPAAPTAEDIFLQDQLLDKIAAGVQAEVTKMQTNN